MKREQNGSSPVTANKENKWSDVLCPQLIGHRAHRGLLVTLSSSISRIMKAWSSFAVPVARKFRLITLSSLYGRKRRSLGRWTLDMTIARELY